MIAPPRPREKVQYQKPRRLNVVSVTLAISLAIFCWVGVSVWPLLLIRSNVKTALADALPRVWKLNLRTEAQARAGLHKLRRETMEIIRKLGVEDDDLDLIIDRSKERVSLRATYSMSTELRGWSRTFTFNFSPSVETDAARVEW